MDNRLKRAPGVYLTGFMGSGKTTVGQLLAEKLGWDFIDLDSEIEAAEKATIAAIFESRGEAEFRRIETGMLKKVMNRVERGMPCVVALGGGAFAQPGNAALLENHGISVWLDCPFETIEQRLARDADSRPLARDRVRFRQLFEDRRAAYGQALYRVDAGCETKRAVESILGLPCWK